MEGNMIRQGVRLVIGGYLIYLGINSFIGMRSGKFDPKWYFILINVVFIVFGAYTLINSVRVMIKEGAVKFADEEDEVMDACEDTKETEPEEADAGTIDKGPGAKDIKSRLKALDIPEEEQEEEI